MFFSNFSADQDTIISYTPYFPGPGFGPKLEGKGVAVRMRNLIIKKSSDEDVIRQYFQTMEGKEWLGVEYVYKRK